MVRQAHHERSTGLPTPRRTRAGRHGTRLVAGKRFLFADRGDTALRGFEDQVRLYEVNWRDNVIRGQA